MEEVRRYSPECFVAHRNSPLRKDKTDGEIVVECVAIQEARDRIAQILKEIKDSKAQGRKPRLVDKIQ